MFLSKFPQLVALLILVCMSKFSFEAFGDVIPSSAACLNCSKCEGPCQQSPPSVSGDPSYGTPTPPAASPPPPPSDYAIYGAPPPPLPPHERAQSKCPPAPGAQCCTPPYPYTISPPNPYTPPYPYTISPPNPYTYVPYGERGNSASMLLLPILVPFMMLSSSFVFLF